MPARMKMTAAEFARATGTRTPRKAAKPPAMVKPTSSLVLTVTLPVVVVSEANQSSSRAGHWAARRRRFQKQKELVFASIMYYSLRVWFADRNPTVTFTRLGGNGLDSDNLAGSFKACRDAVADRLGLDDGDPRISWQYDQRPGPGPQGIEIRIEATEVQR